AASIASIDCLHLGRSMLVVQISIFRPFLNLTFDSGIACSNRRLLLGRRFDLSRFSPPEIARRAYSANQAYPTCPARYLSARTSPSPSNASFSVGYTTREYRVGSPSATHHDQPLALFGSMRSRAEGGSRIERSKR